MTYNSILNSTIDSNFKWWL